MNYTNIVVVALITLILLLFLNNKIEKYTDMPDINFLVNIFNNRTKKIELERELREDKKLYDHVKKIVEEEDERLMKLQNKTPQDERKTRIMLHYKLVLQNIHHN